APRVAYRRRPGSARHAVARLNELLAHAQGLEVHAEDSGNLGFLGAEVILPIDPVENRVDFQRVVALNVLEAVGPGRQVRAWIADCGAGYACGRGHAGKANHVGVDFRRVEVVERSRANAGGDRGVGGVLVGPCCVSASLVNNAEDAVGTDELPRVNGLATITRVADQSLGIDGGDAAVSQGRAGGASIDHGLVDVDA